MKYLLLVQDYAANRPIQLGKGKVFKSICRKHGNAFFYECRKRVSHHLQIRLRGMHGQATTFVLLRLVEADSTLWTKMLCVYETMWKASCPSGHCWNLQKGEEKYARHCKDRMWMLRPVLQVIKRVSTRRAQSCKKECRGNYSQGTRKSPWCT